MDCMAEQACRGKREGGIRGTGGMLMNSDRENQRSGDDVGCGWTTVCPGWRAEAAGLLEMGIVGRGAEVSGKNWCIDSSPVCPSQVIPTRNQLATNWLPTAENSRNILT